MPSQKHLDTLHQTNCTLLKASLHQWKQQNFCLVISKFWLTRRYCFWQRASIYHLCVKSFIFFLGVTMSLSSGYHHQQKKKKKKWAKETSSDRKISDNLLSSSTKTPTGLTPFQCIFSFQPPLFPWSTEPSDVQGVDHWLKESERVWDFARQKEQCWCPEIRPSNIPAQAEGMALNTGHPASPPV